MNLQAYLKCVEDAWNNYNGEEIARLISFRDGHVVSTKLQLEDPEAIVDESLDTGINDLITSHLRCAWSFFIKRDCLEAYRCQALALSCFNKLLSETKDDNWPLPIMYALCLDLRLFAAKADIQLQKKGGKPGETLEKSAELLMNCFRICALDSKTSDEVTKRWGMLNIVNQLFKIYFRVNKLHLCKPLIRAIDQTNLRDHYPKSQQVTFKYYVGRQYMFDNKFPEAEKYLVYAFEKCHPRITSNKRAILTYLIPVKMLLGQMPSLDLLAKYDLLEFREVVLAVKEGNLLRLQAALEANERRFIRCGIFLILEKLKIITYRNLFKKVALISNTHQIPVEAFLRALKLMRVEGIDAEETTCILANLIFEGKIRGYISHAHQKLVVSKQNAFPPLSLAVN